MGITSVVVWGAFALAALPAAMVVSNLLLFMPLPRRVTRRGDRPRVSVLVPARNEEAGIAGAVEAALASEGVDLEVLVLDDHSEDRTAAVVGDIARRDGRVRLLRGAALPADWCGKQHACWQLARAATHDVLVWIDADVTLRRDALARMVDEVNRGGADLISGFPRQVTGTWMEKLVVPLIQVVLLGYLPIFMMRRSASVGFGAGCGQLMMARRASYLAADGHRAIKASMHDGVMLPRAFRRAGLRTDLFDATDLASCRMYRDAAGVWRGFAKNATEGMATPIGLPVWTLLLVGGHVLPWAMMAAWLVGAVEAGELWQRMVIWGAFTMSAATSFALMFRFGQNWMSGLLRPVGVLVLVAIQWYAAGQKMLGNSTGWKGRPGLGTRG